MVAFECFSAESYNRMQLLPIDTLFIVRFDTPFEDVLAS